MVFNLINNVYHEQLPFFFFNTILIFIFFCHSLHLSAADLLKLLWKNLQTSLCFSADSNTFFRKSYTGKHTSEGCSDDQGIFWWFNLKPMAALGVCLSMFSTTYFSICILCEKCMDIQMKIEWIKLIKLPLSFHFTFPHTDMIPYDIIICCYCLFFFYMHSVWVAAVSWQLQHIILMQYSFLYAVEKLTNSESSCLEPRDTK